MKTSNKKLNKKKLVLPKKTTSKINKKTKVKIKKTASKIKTKIKQIATKTKSKTKKIVLKTKAKTKHVAPKSKTTKQQNTKKIIPKKHSSTNVILGPIDVQPYHSRKNEDYMNKKQLAHFRGILLQWKEELMNDVDRTMHHMQDEASNYPDPVDRASQEEEFSLELRTRDRERKLLKKIDETLMRISEEDYGYCDDCGAEIGIRRLEARPTATQCIECKTIAEIREKQIGESN